MDFPRIMLLDMNSFFASVEQQANPVFRGKPLGVVASMHPTSCLIAASIEAKKMGIKTGTLIYKAQRICPDIILTEAEPAKYREVNKRFNKILNDYTDKVETYSIDESFLDLSEQKVNPLIVGAEIKRRIRSEVGEWLTCSVGVAENKFLAKLAADLKKPDGLSVIWREQLREIYKNKKLSDLWGVGRGWEKRLAKIGIIRPVQVLDYPLQNLISLFGKPGFYLWQRINGLEKDEIISEESDPKSFGHSWVLNFRTTDKRRLLAVVMYLAEKAARRMRKDEFQAYGVYLSVTMANRTYTGKSIILKTPISTGVELAEAIKNFWESINFSADVVHIATGFTRLTKQSVQLNLFNKTPHKLVKHLDEINNKYGEFTIRSGLLTNSSDYAPDAIAFGK